MAKVKGKFIMMECSLLETYPEAKDEASQSYDCILIEGVYEGILEKMCGIKQYKVIQTRCVKKGDPVCEYDITWKEA
jgi:predicted hydrocarbon binding protein